MTPLARRLPRELKNNIGKYLGIFLLMCGAIALTSGFLLAAHSIGSIIDEMGDEYTIEDGRIVTAFEATDAQIDAAEGAADGVGGVTFFKNFSIDAAIKKPTGDDGTKRTLRTYTHRTEIDIASYCEGAKPQTDDEVAIDRVFATNNELAIGDKVELEGRAYTICGIMTQPDSQALFLNNSDFTVNTITYGVAEVTDAGFAALEDAGGAPAYTYSFTFDDRDLSTADRTDAEQDMVEALTDADARVDDLIDADSNQGIGYARDDVDGDSMMWTTLLDIIIVIMAFVFVVLTDATIEDESAIIGTLLASGYRRREIVLHYLALPAIMGVAAALLGTALGVTFFTEPMRGLYYGSYSLPPFQVYWSWEIFVKCAVVPAAALILITLVGLLRKMGKTPLQFLRHEASGKAGTKRGLRLPERMGFVARFRLRVFLRNLGNFVTLFVGIAFASLLLLFGLAILPTMTHYADNLETSLVAEHQYTLKAPLELEGTDEERDQWAALERLQSVDGALITAAQDSDDDDTQNDQIHAAVGATHQDHVAETAGSGQHFSGHQGCPCVADGDFDASEGHGHGGGDAHLPKAGKGSRTEGFTHVDQHFLGLADAGIGIDQAGNECCEENNERLGLQADAHPDDGQWNPRHGRYGANNFKNRTHKRVKASVPAHEPTQGNADDQRETEAAQRNLQAGPDVHNQNGAIGVGIRQFYNEELENFQYIAQLLAVNSSGDNQQFPNQEKKSNAADRKHGIAEFDLSVLGFNQLNTRIVAHHVRRFAHNILPTFCDSVRQGSRRIGSG